MRGVLLACVLHAAGAGDAPAVLAIVNGDPVPAALFRMYVENAAEALGVPRSNAAARLEIERSVADELIDRTLIVQEGRRRRLPVREEDVREHERTWIARLGGDDAYRAYLRAHALDAREFRESMMHELYAERLRAALTSDLDVAEQEILDTHRREPVAAPEQIAAAHILVKTRAEAEMLRRDLLAGARFEELARARSMDRSSSGDGGSLGVFARGAHVAAFDEAAFSLAPGQISQIVQTPFGFHIIQVTARHPSRLRNVDETRDAIRVRLLARKAAARLTDWLAEHRRRASIRFDPAYTRIAAGGEQ